MAQGNSGSFTLTGSQNFAVIINWSETYNESANTHVVSITSCQLVSYNWYGFTYYPNGTLSINGSTVVTFNSQTGTHNCTIQSQSTGYPIIPATGSSYPAAPWSSGTISGNADGTKSVSIAANFQCFTWDGKGGSGWSVSGSQTVTLHTIPRTSSISMPATTMGSANNITITRASSSFTHTLTYAFGNATGTIATKTTSTSVSWTPPTSLASQIPNNTTGTCTLTCYTYNGNTLVGTSTATVTLTVPASIKPTITGITATRVDGTVPSTWGIYVQTKSKVTLAITGAAGAGGSTISSYSITGGGLSYTQSSVTTGFLNTSGSITFTGKVCDSRGRWSDEATVTINVVAYAAPRFNSYSTQRCTSAGASSSNGTYAKSTVNYSYWSCSGKNTITTAVAYKKSADSSYTNAGVTFTSGTQFIFGGGNLSVDYSYDIRFTLTDAFGTVTVVDSLSTASVLMDFKAGGTGLAVGKVSETDSCFEVSEDWDVKVYGMLLEQYILSKMSGGIAFASCETAVDEQDKVATASGNFTLATGTVVAVKFTNSNSASQPRLNVNGTGAKYIVTYNNYTPPNYAWKPLQMVLFIYDGTYYVAFTLSYATTGYYGITKLSNSIASTSTTLAATANAVKLAYDRNSWDSITLTNALAIAYGGTGATSAAGARTNLGIGVTLLYSGTMTTGSASFAYGAYNFYVIIGQPSSSGSRTPIVVPKAALTTGSVAYQITDESYYYSFNLYYSGSTVYMSYKGRNSSGQIIAVYGVN